MNLRDSKKDADWMLKDCMHVYDMNSDEQRNAKMKKEILESFKKTNERV